MSDKLNTEISWFNSKLKSQASIDYVLLNDGDAQLVKKLRSNHYTYST